ncbi:hypothetical protein OUZ56_000544 [Daphnia magna]|uniref:Uncharacterized protein n=1 Tax=Daphnia magna TaxID=35525 RepID=A0ABQ9ZZZ9_9CRUS|nr:hypothetical protein OUZ56_000544 [Daphnia magna]
MILIAQAVTFASSLSSSTLSPLPHRSLSSSTLSHSRHRCLQSIYPKNPLPSNTEKMTKKVHLSRQPTSMEGDYRGSSL